MARPLRSPRPIAARDDGAERTTLTVLTPPLWSPLIPRHGGASEDRDRAGSPGGRGVRHALASVAAVGRPPYPADDFAQTAAVMAALASASASLTADALAASFKQGRKVAPKVAAVHAALALSNDIRKGTSGDPHGMVEQPTAASASSFAGQPDPPVAPRGGESK